LSENEEFEVFFLKDGLYSRVRLLPPVHEAVADLMKLDEIKERYDVSTITWGVRNALDKARSSLLERNAEKGSLFDPAVCIGFEPIAWQEKIRVWVKEEALKGLEGFHSTLIRVINATGVILHTNCGRALLAPEVADFVVRQSSSYSNLELNIKTGSRGSRYDHIQRILTELTGAEAALVVNNNAAAVLLVMSTFGNQKEVIVSRGELVEVGGSFRIPEVIKAGGARLVEVGATNKTWLKDYRIAVSQDTAMFLKVHTSNYRIEGFHHSVSTEALVELGNELGIPVVEDLGSGSFLDGVDLGLPKEPTIQEAIKTGATLVTFSGDKLLGGPQAGIIVGKRDYVDKLKENQLLRAIRVDKLTLAALAGTLELYRRNEVSKIPVWRMLGKRKEEMEKEAGAMQLQLQGMKNLETLIQADYSCVGGGAFPTSTLPTVVLAVKPLNGSSATLEKFLREGCVPILARIAKDSILIDPRTLLPGDELEVINRLREWDSN
jgi:L-seryl-tRNA(Ser) seleniumtransferase